MEASDDFIGGKHGVGTEVLGVQASGGSGSGTCSRLQAPPSGGSGVLAPVGWAKRLVAFTAPPPPVSWRLMALSSVVLSSLEKLYLEDRPGNCLALSGDSPGPLLCRS